MEKISLEDLMYNIGMSVADEIINVEDQVGVVTSDVYVDTINSITSAYLTLKIESDELGEDEIDSTLKQLYSDLYESMSYIVKTKGAN